MIAIVIIVASKGTASRRGWRPAAPGRGPGRCEPLGLDPPPDLVEELEQREDRLGELLVEAPLVLVVVALEPADERLERVAQPAAAASPPPAAAAAQRVEARLDAAADARAGSRRSPPGASARRRARSRPAPGQPAGERAGVQARADPAPRVFAARSRIAADRVEARLVAELLAQPAVVDAAAEAQQPDPVAEQAAGAEPARRAAAAAARTAGAGTGSGGRRSRRSARLSEIDAVGGDVDRRREPGCATAATSAPVASSAWSNCSRGSKPSWTGTTGSVR